MNGAFLANTNSKLNTEMTSTTGTTFYKQPTHDEIALDAFLSWQKEGSPQGTGFDHWIEAERRLRAQRQKQAEAAAAQATKPWPPGARAAKNKSASTAKPILAAAGESATAVKLPRAAAQRSTRRTSGT